MSQIIDKRLKQKPEDVPHPKDILQLLIENSSSSSSGKEQDNTQNDENVAPLTEAEMIANCIVFILAGHETTAVTLTFALCLLAIHPHIQLEFEELVNQSKQDNNQQQQAAVQTFLENIVKETLRLYPVAGGLSRKLLRDVEFEGKKLPKGETFFYCFSAVQRSPKYWGDQANDFIPSRFSTEQVQTKLRDNPFIFTPFGVGHRSCIGKKFAMVEMVQVLGELMKRYTIKLADPKYKLEEEKKSLTTQPKHEVKLVFEQKTKLIQ